MSLLTCRNEQRWLRNNFLNFGDNCLPCTDSQEIISFVHLTIKNIIFINNNIIPFRLTNSVGFMNAKHD